MADRMSSSTSLQGEAAGLDGMRQVSEAAEKLADMDMVDHVQGFFEVVPENWLHQLVTDLPPASKLALFAASKGTAKGVVESAAGVTVMLCACRRLTAQQTETRVGVITELLCERRGFAVHLQSAAWQLFPIQIADRVTSLTYVSMEGVVGTYGHWGTMTNLRNICLEGPVYETDTAGLCDAVKAGQLKKLQCMQLGAWDKKPSLTRLLRTLAPQIEEVWDTTQYGNLVLQLHLLTSLKSLTFTGLYNLTRGMMHHLCAHPTLTHVTFYNLQLRVGHSRCKCKWQSVTLHSFDGAASLRKLPLAGVQEIVIGGSLYVSKAFIVTLEQHVNKMVCLHGLTLRLDLQYACEVVVQLLRRMQGAQTLALVGVARTLDMIPVLYQAMPTSVSTIQLYCTQYFTGLDWTRLWLNLPRHVAKVEVDVSSINATDLHTLISCAPAHVRTMVLIGHKAADKEVWAVPDPHTPAHLKVLLRDTY